MACTGAGGGHAQVIIPGGTGGSGGPQADKVEVVLLVDLVVYMEVVWWRIQWWCRW